MKRVSRHPPFDVAEIRRRFEHYSSYMEECYVVAGREPDVLPSIMGPLLDVARTGSVVQPESPRIVVALRAAAVAGASFVEACFANGAPITFAFEEHNGITYNNYKVDPSWLSAQLWLQTFFIASMCRQADLTKKLGSVTSEQLREGRKIPEYRLLLIDAVLGILRNENYSQEVSSLLVDAMSATDPARSDVNKLIALNIDIHIIRTLFYLHSRDVVAFNEALYEGLKAHKKYWGSASRKHLMEGFLALELTGIAAMAHDRGISIEVESGYLLPEVISGKVCAE